MKLSINIFASLAVVLLLCKPTANAVVRLVENGQSVVTIVSGKDDGISKTHTLVHSDVTLAVPSRALDLAARDMADYLNEMGWIAVNEKTVRVVDTIDEADTPYRVLLGTAAIEAYGLEDEAAALSYPGYIYRTVGNDLLIFGATSKGTANGVYGFLQDELGIRWFGPQELFTVVPSRESIELSDIDEKVEPSYTGRFGIVGPMENPTDAWRRRMRIAEPRDSHTFAGIEPFSAASHYLHHVVPVAQYFDEHPEYYSMRGNQRRLHSNPTHTNLCWSNPEVIDLAVEAARNRFSKGDYYHSFSLGMTDADAYCECDDCVELQPEKTYRGRSGALQPVASDMYFHFVNEVAREVKTEYPDRYLGVIAYNDVSLPPEGEIEDNVFVILVLDISEHYDEQVRREDMKLVEMWQGKNVILGLYYYLGLAKLVPAYFPHTSAEILKDFHSRGFRALINEASPGWPWTGPMIYLNARLWWDVNLDVNLVMDEYFSMFGPAAVHVKAMYERFESIHMRQRPGGFLYEHYNLDQFRPYTRDDYEVVTGLIASAHASIEELGTDRLGRARQYERRLAYVTNGLRPFLDMLQGVVIARELEEITDADMDDPFALPLALEKVNILQTLIERHERVYREGIIMDKYQGNRYTVDTVTVVREQWKFRLNKVAGRILVELMEKVSDDDAIANSSMRGRVTESAERFMRRDLNNEALFKLGTGEWQLGDANLISNPGFETVSGESGSAPEQRSDWKPPMAADWSVHQIVEQGRFTISEEVVLEGERAALLEGVGRGALIGLAPGVEPGELYLLQTAVLLDAEPEDGASVRVMMRWRDAAGKWLSEHASIYADPSEEWIYLDRLFEVPAEARTAVVILSVSNLAAGSSAYFDAVSLRRIQMME